MIYVNEKKQTAELTYYKNSTPQTSEGVSFDAVFETEAILYATPTSSGTQSAPTQSTSTKYPSNQQQLNVFFQKASNRYGIDIDLLKAVAKAESGFDASAVSNTGAIGIMQLMPSTASSLGVTNLYDPEENIMGGANYLSQLLNQYNGNISLALAAYNAGPGNVDKYNGIPPFKETQNYVAKVLEYYGKPTGASAPNILYAVAATTSKDSTNDSPLAATIYAVAANDATNIRF